MIKPRKRTWALLVSRTTTADISIRTKQASINQKVPTSNIAPKRDVLIVGEKRVESKNAKTMPRPDHNNRDLGTFIFPSKNRAMVQKIIEITSPTTKSKPLEISVGMLVKGRKKAGKSTIIIKTEIKQILSKIFNIIIVVIIL